jgi:hypothetical protein
MMRITSLELRVIPRNVDHGGNEEGEIDAFAGYGRKDRFRIQASVQMHAAASHQHRQDLRAGDVADRRSDKVAWLRRDFEVGNDRGGEDGIFAVVPQRPLDLPVVPTV